MSDTQSYERLLALLEMAGKAEEALDNETYEQFRRADFEMPNDAEMWVTAGTVRKLFKVLAAIDALRARQAKP